MTLPSFTCSITNPLFHPSSALLHLSLLFATAMAEPTEAPVALEAVSEEPKTVEDLNKLITTANLAYSQKHWEAAVEAYSEAAQVQDMINGEMAPENAELLYLYGRCLYKVGVSKSAVLGGQAVSEKTNIKKLDQDKDTLKPVGESVVQIDVEEEEEEEEEEEAEEDDLDMARVLFEKQLEAQKSVVSDESGDSKGKGSASQEMSPQVRHLIERLADTHDWQAEIALENERFDDAADESRSMLKYRQQIYSEDSRLVSEAHFKLALALEFTFFTAVREAKEAEAMQLGQSKENKDTLDPKVLHEAIEELVRAIQSCESRLEKDVAKSSELSGDDAKKNEADITDQKEIIHDMLAKVIQSFTASYVANIRPALRSS